MGYTAYRAYTTGASSINPQTVALAKVRRPANSTVFCQREDALCDTDSYQHGATLYTIQLGLNLIWTPLYFSMHRPIAATADIVVLFGTVAYLANVWGQVDPVCGWLLAPYLAWLSFATYLCV